MQLLGTDESAAFSEMNRSGHGNFVIVVDHASNRIPRCLGTLGLAPQDLQRHIAWDIGALAVAERVAQLLDSPLVAQSYSRLVIDCNRDPGVETSIPITAENTTVPGNVGLTPDQLDARRIEIFEPYHAAIRRLLDQRRAAGVATILVAQHSMTNVFKGSSRNMHAAVLYNRDPSFATATAAALRQESELTVAENEPYNLSDETDYTIPRHGEARGLKHVEIEIRQDLILSKAGQEEWGGRIASALRQAASCR